MFLTPDRVAHLFMRFAFRLPFTGQKVHVTGARLSRSRQNSLNGCETYSRWILPTVGDMFRNICWSVKVMPLGLEWGAALILEPPRTTVNSHPRREVAGRFADGVRTRWRK
jgi:hypothetical protein